MALKPIRKETYLRVSLAIHDEVHEIAQQEERSLINVTNRLLRKALDDYNEEQDI